MLRFCFFILLIFAAGSLRANSQEDEYLRLLDKTEQEFDSDPVKGLATVDRILTEVDPQTMPRVWLRAYRWLLEEKGYEALFAKLDEAIQLAAAQNMHEMQTRLMILKVPSKEASEKLPEVQAYYSEMKKAAELSNDRMLVVSVLSFEANYLYSINQIPAGFKVVYEAMNRMERENATNTALYHQVKGTLGTLIFATGDKQKAIRIWEECFHWAEANALKQEMSSNAYNIANTLINMDEKDDSRILYYLDVTLKVAEEQHDDGFIGKALYGKGKFALSRQRYEDALPLFDRARPIFFQTENPNFAGMCLVYKAQAYVGLNRLKEAEETLDLASQELKPEVTFGHMLILESRHEIAERRGDFVKAHEYLKKYLQEWKAQKEVEEKEQMQKLSTSLGLKLEEERNRNLQDENALQSAKLKEAERFRLFVIAMGILSLLALSLLLYALRQSRKVAESQKKMQLTLDNIDEGVLTIASDQTIGSEYSRHLLNLLGMSDDPGGSDFIERVFADSSLSNEEKSIAREVLKATFHETEVAWSMNGHLLPEETFLGVDKKKCIAIRWVPIFDRQGLLSHVLVSLLDITQRRELELAFRNQKQQLQALPQLVREIRLASPERFLPVLAQTEQALDRLELSFGDSARSSHLASLHTAKGNARTLGLRSLSEQLHELESLVQSNVKVDDALRSQCIKGLRRILGEYREWASALHDEIHPEASKHSALLDGIRSQMGTWINHLAGSQLQCQEISVVDQVLSWPPLLKERLPDMLMHAVSNSLDHGFVLPHQKGMKVSPACLQILGTIRDSNIRLEIRDNGRGLNWEKLSSLAREKNFVPGAGQTAADIVFWDGITTADRLTLASGRGVGLAAIKHFCEEHKGRVGIQDNDRGQGTLLWIEFPQAQIEVAA